MERQEAAALQPKTFYRQIALSGVPIALGLFSTIAQTVIFREFLTVVEGNEFSTACFFAGWLFWVGIGATTPNRISWKGENKVGPSLPVVCLFYIPILALQFQLMHYARPLARVETFELFPLGRMIVTTLALTAPFSFTTGYLFVKTCRWASERDRPLPVAYVYVLETLGAFIGGVSATLFLAYGNTSETLILIGACLFAVLVGLTHMTDERRPRHMQDMILGLTALGLIGATAAGTGTAWSSYNQGSLWRRMIPTGQFGGHFTTPQTLYLYGWNRDQLVVLSWGGVCETLPEKEHASQVVAMHLAQRPKSRRIAVVGQSALAICSRFLEAPTTETVVWFCPDAAYPKRLLQIAPDMFPTDKERFGIASEEPRVYFSHSHADQPKFDLILLSVGDLSSLVTNRYVTREFFAALKRHLSEGGVISVRFRGPVNYMSSELAYLGASILQTLRTSFAHIALKPGEESWFLASDAPLSENPDELCSLFASIPDASEIYPTTGLSALYPVDRIAFQREAYETLMTQGNETILLNTDGAPKSLVYSLSATLHLYSDLALAEVFPAVFATVPVLCFALLLLYGSFRLTYIWRHYRADAAKPNMFDAAILVFGTGVASMSFNLTLLFAYQYQFGSLYLDVGLLTAVFMLGIFLGGSLTKSVVSRHPNRILFFLFGVLLVYIAFALSVPVLPRNLSKTFWRIIVLGAGVVNGTFFPASAYLFDRLGHKVEASSRWLEFLDHMGGAFGAAFTGLILLPFLGMAQTLLAVSLFLVEWVALVFLASGRGLPVVPTDRYDLWVRRIGYVATGFAVLLLIASDLFSYYNRTDEIQQLQEIARKFLPEAQLQQRSAMLLDGRSFVYLEAPEKQTFVFAARDLAPNALAGYAGPVNIAVVMGKDGVLQGVEFLQNDETPAYLEMVRTWLPKLYEKNLLRAPSELNVDGCSGATLTSAAVLDALRKAAPTFARIVLEAPLKQDSYEGNISQWDWASALFLAFLAALAVMRTYPNRTVRRLFLLGIVVVLGYRFNMQYAAQHIATFVGLKPLFPSFRPAFLLTVGVPVLVIVFGNLYCGYLCPFGAFQELLGDLIPKKFSVSLNKMTWRYARHVKYGLLFFLVLLFALTRNPSVFNSDPLTTWFTAHPSRFTIILGATALVFALFFPRFWCRNLCPSGAFLALLGGVRLMRRFLPTTAPIRCDLGVRSTAELDCICCDRCRMPSAPDVTVQPPEKSPWLYGVLIATCATLALSMGFYSLAETSLWKEKSAPIVSQPRSAVTGKPRNVDMERLHRMIRRGLLSDREALYYRRDSDRPSRHSN